ncbi:hypothetical protein [Arthrobacter woluwensis]|uniref:hypothetical protein n=1 Tax=Arthrobacter woluwensis TaxID=156980 RepID=UPI001587BC90|nr:hypothetical protein [Arthrobacter woluwensis]
MMSTSGPIAEMIPVKIVTTGGRIVVTRFTMIGTSELTIAVISGAIAPTTFAKTGARSCNAPPIAPAALARTGAISLKAPEMTPEIVPTVSLMVGRTPAMAPANAPMTPATVPMRSGITSARPLKIVAIGEAAVTIPAICPMMDPKIGISGPNESPIASKIL